MSENKDTGLCENRAQQWRFFAPIVQWIPPKRVGRLRRWLGRALYRLAMRVDPAIWL